MVLTQGQVEEAWKLADQIKDKEDPEYSHIIAEIMIFEGKEEEANQYLEDWYQERKDEEYMEDYAMDTAWLLLDLGLPDLAWKWLDYVDDRDEEEYLELCKRIPVAGIILCNGDIDASTVAGQDIPIVNIEKRKEKIMKYQK